MNVVTVMPRQSYDWSVDDLDQLPDDGLQYELLDGLLLVTPAPAPRHQDLVGGLYRLLWAACPAAYNVYFAPLDWRPDGRTSLQPDLLVVERDQVGQQNITEPILLAVEVLSPSTRRKDLVLKRSKYEDAGVPSYWVVDPGDPTVTVFELRDGAYNEVGTVGAADSLEVNRPFPVTIVPSELA